MQEWEKILKENSFNYELNYDHEFCREYIIEDKLNFLWAQMQLFES
jgi:hypothetical protein